MSKLIAGSKAILRAVLPLGVQRWLRRRSLIDNPLLLHGRRLAPISRDFGFDRGHSVDRYYIESFLRRHSGDIKGHVLEIKDSKYTRRFGNSSITQSDVLDIDPANPEATICLDLARTEQVIRDAFDCIICTQTLLLIYDFRSAAQSLVQMLKPGGVLLVTVPGISQICRFEMDHGGDYWRFTSLSLRRLFEELLPPENTTVTSYGNVLTATAFLYGLAQEELQTEELEHCDPDYEIVIAMRAVKPC